MTLDPESFRWAYYYAELARNLGQTDAAIERLQHARSLKPGYRALDLHLASAWLKATGVIRHLNLADPRQAFLTPPDQVSFADLRVIEVEVYPQLRSIDG